VSYRIGIDVGGTFTDLVAVDEAGRVTHAKSASTPGDQSIGVMDGLALLADSLGFALAPVLARTERIVHGTTVATNALLERRGARVGLLTTDGHIDILEMREGLKDDRYNLRMAAPEPLVPRDRRLGVKERIRPDGRTDSTLSNASLLEAIQELRRQKVDSVAVCYLHSYRDPTHERMTGEAVRSAMPDVYVSLSSDVLPQIKEYERTCTTVVNAYVGPALDLYLGRLATRLRQEGFQGPLLVIQSHGGVATVTDAIRLAAGAVLSGPAGGVAGGRHAAHLIGHEDLIPFDMGGTSTDISLIVHGEAAIASDRRLAGHRVGLQSLDIVSIGAGGGSLARVDAGGVLHVGPESAGALPGPACYDRGGTVATVTDANLVLGYLDAASFLGGRARLNAAAAEAAVGPNRRVAWGRPHDGRGGYPSSSQHAHGRRHKAGLGAARHRPEALCAPLLWRRRRLAHHGHRSSARSPAGCGAAPRGRALGVGDAGKRLALRARPHPHRRRQRARGGRSSRRLRGNGSRGSA
jgi:N-methylhydantoinase A